MARLVILSVYDVKVGAYMRPMFVPAVGAGVRAFTDEVNRTGSEMNNHPEDYCLYRLGEFDEADGGFHEMPHRPEMIAQAATVLVQKKSDLN